MNDLITLIPLLFHKCNCVAIFNCYIINFVMGSSKRKFSGEHLCQFVCSANEIVNFRFVLSDSEIDDDAKAFKAEFTHQFFGDSENIFGYIGLGINLTYSACHLQPFFSMTYCEKVKPSQTGGIEADNIYKIICDKQELAPSRDLDAFVKSLGKESSFRPHGELLSSFPMKNSESEVTYCVYRADNSTPGFRGYHERMQTLIFWFIDAASYIDEDDERWDYFVMHKHIKIDGKDYYPFVGYATVYRYYAYPLKTRPRISQMLVLPPFQKHGLGSRLLECISEWYIKDVDVLDITVEDPSEEFIRIRDYIDCKKCEALPSFTKENLEKGFDPNMLEEARDKFKINKKQTRRVYEILRLKSTDMQNEEAYRKYRLDVKNRLNIPFQREKLDMEKLKKNLTPEELKAAANLIPREQRIEQLDHVYAELEEKYKHIIDRLILEKKK